MAKEFCIMGRDECGDDFCIETFTIKAEVLDSNENVILSYQDLANAYLEKRFNEIREQYPECFSIWIERKYSSMSLSEMYALGFGGSGW